MMKAKKFKRSFWRVVNPDVEVKYTLVVAWLIILGFLISGLVTYLTIWNNLLVLPQLTQPEHLLIIQKKILKLLGVEFLLGGLLVVVMAAILQFRILHRISGPLHRLEKVIQDVASGKLPKTPIILRKKDLYSDLTDAFNRLVDRIRAGDKFE